jgi:CDP-glycerol glycerophosphotransferase
MQSKVVFSNFEGRGYGCNPKYIAEELRRRNARRPRNKQYQLIWLVDDMDKEFPGGIEKVKNNAWNRARQLSTGAVWIDNVRKPLETRKRAKQLYIGTWHGAIGFKPVGKLRGKAFPKIAYLVSKHDSDMVDYFLSNSEWCSSMYRQAFFYEGKVLKSGSPRCDILINKNRELIGRIRKEHQIPIDSKILLYAPTFRGGNQRTAGMDVESENLSINFEKLIETLEGKFRGKWYVFIRLHPNLTKQNKQHLINTNSKRVIDVTQYDDAYELLASADAFISDYSSLAFDAASMRIPVFIYADDMQQYVEERGELLWEMSDLPFPLAGNNDELLHNISRFDIRHYEEGLEGLFESVDLLEDGRASARVADVIDDFMAGKA